jgi:predicted amidophosphoribosyltransferase
MSGERTWCTKCEHSCNSPYCGTCGSRTIAYTYACPHCKAEIYVTDKFCKECGKPIQEEVNSCVESEKYKLLGE